MEHIRSTVSYLMEASNTRYQNYMKTMLKERSVGKLMRGGGGGTYSTYQSGDLIMEGVRRAGHRFKMDRRTQGDGNCFPRAAKQQCDRPAVEVNSIQCHEDLRRKVANYMLQSKDMLVADMRERWQELEVRWSWKSYWQNMARDGVWVEEPFIWATAWFLNRDIWIVWDTATPGSPLTFFSGDKEGNGTACPGVPLIIGHHTDTHYQSLLPEGDLVSTSLDVRSFAVEVNKTLEKVGEVLQRKSRLKRKEPPGSSDTEDADVEIAILNYKGEKPGVEAKRLQDGSTEYRCLLCQSLSKQIVSHMKKEHSDMFQSEELTGFQASIKKFVNAFKVKFSRRRKRERDPEGVKKALKRENEARRGNGERKFKEDGKYGHIFPCVCCHTLKHRDQVVELNQQQEDKIDGKAREIHQTLQVEISHKNLKYEI